MSIAPTTEARSHKQVWINTCSGVHAASKHKENAVAVSTFWSSVMMFSHLPWKEPTTTQNQYRGSQQRYLISKPSCQRGSACPMMRDPSDSGQGHPCNQSSTLLKNQHFCSCTSVQNLCKLINNQRDRGQLPGGSPGASRRFYLLQKTTTPSTRERRYVTAHAMPQALSCGFLSRSGTNKVGRGVEPGSRASLWSAAP